MDGHYAHRHDGAGRRAAMTPTALHLFVRHLLGGPDTPVLPELHAWLERTPARTDRERAMRDYLLAASRSGGLSHAQTRRGSLKHLLWWLRDHAGSLYEPAALAVLEAACASETPLEDLAESLRAHPLIGGLVQQALRSERADDLVRHLLFEDSPRGRVAWNRTTLNLSKLAFARGARYYAALSIEGGCLMAARGTVMLEFPLTDGWSQPYPNLVLLRRPAQLQDESHLRRYLHG